MERARGKGAQLHLERQADHGVAELVEEHRYQDDRQQHQNPMAHRLQALRLEPLVPERQRTEIGDDSENGASLVQQVAGAVPFHRRHGNWDD